MSNTLGDFLYTMRKERKLSLKEVEKETEISSSYINRLEKGNRGNPSIFILEKLSDFYKVSPAKVLEIAGFKCDESSNIGNLNSFLDSCLTVKIDGQQVSSSLLSELSHIVMSIDTGDFSQIVELTKLIERIQNNLSNK